MTPARDQPFLIAGGGIGGLATALALARDGFAAHVLERAREFGEIGAGIQLGPNANRVLDRLGLTAAMQSVIVDVDELRLMDSLNDGELITVPLGDSVKRRFGAPYYVAHRADLHRVLFAACDQNELIRLDTSHPVTRYEQQPGAVMIETEGGERHQGCALVGADGLWSTVRAQLLGDGKPRFAHHTCYRTLLEPEEMPEDLRWKAATLWAGPNTHLVHYPISAGAKYNIVAIYASDDYQEGWNEPGDADELRYHFRKLSARPRQILERATSWRRWALCDRPPVSRWGDGRVTLLGDAAHPMLQYFAQGAAMAMEDAVTLASCITAADGEVEPGLRAYEAARMPRTARAQASAINLGKMYHATGFKRLARNMIMKTTTPKKMLDRVAWCYEGP